MSHEKKITKCRFINCQNATRERWNVALTIFLIKIDNYSWQIFFLNCTVFLYFFLSSLCWEITQFLTAAAVAGPHSHDFTRKDIHAILMKYMYIYLFSQMHEINLSTRLHFPRLFKVFCT
jgi:hypothetical protein